MFQVLAMAGLSSLSLLHSNLDEIQVFFLQAFIQFLFSRMTFTQDWGVVLSLGEQQRVAFARCFFMEPTVVILDESTSALDPENEDMMYVPDSASFCSVM